MIVVFPASAPLTKLTVYVAVLLENFGSVLQCSTE